MKSKKKIIYISFSLITILIVIIVVFIYYIKVNDIRMTGKVRVHSIFAYTDQGITYNMDKFFRYVDASSGKAVVLCDKPHCRHIDSTCNAYKDFHLRGLAIYNGKLFYVKEENDRTLTVYKADTNSTNRKAIVKLKELQNNTAAVYMDNYLLYAYRNSFIYDDDSVGPVGELEKPSAGLAIINLHKRKVVYVPEKADYDATILHPYLYDNKIYYLYLYLDVKIDYTKDIAAIDQDYINNHTYYRIYCYDIATNSETVIFEGKNISLEDYSESKAFIVESSGDYNRIYSLDLLTQEKNLLIEENADKSLRCFADGDRIIYYSYKRNDNSSRYHYYYYDLVSQSKVEIGESDYFAVISEIVNDKIYLSFYDQSSGELQLGYIMKDDFYAFKFDKAVPLKLEYND